MDIRRISETAALGGVIGGAIGIILDGTLLLLPGGREIVIAKAIGDIVFATAAATTTTVSASAIGTLVGAASAAATDVRRKE